MGGSLAAAQGDVSDLRESGSRLSFRTTVRRGMLCGLSAQPAVKRGYFWQIPVLRRTHKIVGANVRRDLLAGDREPAETHIVSYQAPPCERQPTASLGRSYDRGGFVGAHAQCGLVVRPVEQPIAPWLGDAVQQS